MLRRISSESYSKAEVKNLMGDFNMKKVLITLLFVLTVSTMGFAEKKIVATTYQTSLKPQDMVEIFVEELNRDKYQYQIADYEVYTKPEEQNYAWAVKIDTEGYYCNNGLTNVCERSVYLFMKNGYVRLSTFGGPTLIGFKKCIDSKGGLGEIRDSLYDAIGLFTDESITWLKRYNESYSEDEFEALVMLNSLDFLILDYYVSDCKFRGKYNNYLLDSEVTCVESNTLNWISPSWLSGSNEELLLLSFCKKHNTQFLVENCGTTLYKDKEDYKKSELKKLKKEGYDIVLDFRTQYRFYKVQDNKIVCVLVDFYPYYKIDDILLGNYKSCKIGNTEVEYHERFYRYVDNQGNIIYEYSK